MLPDLPPRLSHLSSLCVRDVTSKSEARRAAGRSVRLGKFDVNRFLPLLLLGTPNDVGEEIAKTQRGLGMVRRRAYPWLSSTGAVPCPFVRGRGVSSTTRKVGSRLKGRRASR